MVYAWAKDQTHVQFVETYKNLDQKHATTGTDKVETDAPQIAKKKQTHIAQMELVRVPFVETP